MQAWRRWPIGCGSMASTVCRFSVNPNYAQKSGCTAEDIELLKLLIPHAYELNRSAIRPTSASATHGIWSIRACLAAARIISCWKR